MLSPALAERIASRSEQSIGIHRSGVGSSVRVTVKSAANACGAAASARRAAATPIQILIGLAYDGSPLALFDGTDDGQVDVECRALALARLDPHVPLHPPRELTADVEPEAGAEDTPAQGRG